MAENHGKGRGIWKYFQYGWLLAGVGLTGFFGWILNGASTHVEIETAWQLYAFYLSIGLIPFGVFIYWGVLWLAVDFLPANPPVQFVFLAACYLLIGYGQWYVLLPRLCQRLGLAWRRRHQNRADR